MKQAQSDRTLSQSPIPVQTHLPVILGHYHRADRPSGMTMGKLKQTKSWSLARVLVQLLADNLLCDYAAIPDAFPLDCVARPAHCTFAGLLFDGGGYGILGRTIFLVWHPAISLLGLCSRFVVLIDLLPPPLPIMHPTPIYLDHNATTPLDPDVLEAMRPYFLAGGNAESRHAFGRLARRGLEFATETVAQILGADPTEVIFTSGGTEANNLAIFGLAGAENSPGHVISSPFEHPAVAEPIARLQAAGFERGAFTR